MTPNPRVLQGFSLVAGLFVALLTTAAPATATAGDEESPLSVGAQVFTGWEGYWRGDDQFNEWELQRAEFQGRWHHSADRFDAGLVLITEVVRSAGPRGFFGVDGDSLVARGKQAWGFFQVPIGPIALEARGGLVPDIWVHTLETPYDLRGLAATQAESAGFFDTSDLGASVHLETWEERFHLAISLTNGEGRAQREQNPGKNLTATASLTAWRDADSELRFHLAGRDGSRGVSSSADHRAALGATVVLPRFAMGTEATLAFGYEGRGDREALGAAGWVWLRPIDFAPGLALRAEYFLPDRDLPDTHRTEVLSALYYDVLPPTTPSRLRAYLGYAHLTGGDLTGPLPGVPNAARQHTLFLRLELFFLHGV